MIQESLNNVIKHSEATAAKVSISISDKSVHTQIMDNGKGFDYEPTVIIGKGLGLRTMHERISSIGGRMKIEKNNPKGVVVNFSISKKSRPLLR